MRIQLKCDQCQCEFVRPDGRGGDPRSKHCFCSKKCSATFANHAKPKRKKLVRICTKCKAEFVPVKRQSNCRLCDAAQVTETLKRMTMREYLATHKYLAHANRLTAIRGAGRIWNKHMLLLPCAVCGYRNHVELHHIKQISSFSEDATLGEINAESNLIQLCPNHHWELEHKLISIDSIKAGLPLQVAQP